MADIKHIGRIKSTGRKVLVAYRTIPGDPNSALVIQTENLPQDQHDALITLVESNAAQNAGEFAEVLARSSFPEGGNMLPTLHLQGKLTKVATSEIEMTPNMQIVVALSDLNNLIAQQMGVTLEELAVKSSKPKTEVQEVAKIKDLTESEFVQEQTILDEQPLTDDDLAKRMRSDADRLYKEAARLRAEADKLSPIKKKTKETA
jgi:ribosomal protein S13